MSDGLKIKVMLYKELLDNVLISEERYYKIIESLVNEELSFKNVSFGKLNGSSFSVEKSVILKDVAKNGNALYRASDELKNDREVVMTAISQSGLALCFASDELKNDKEVVLAAIMKDSNALYYASEELKNDKQFLEQIKMFQEESETMVFSVDDELEHRVKGR